jgi:hypothetical protein
MVLRPVWPSTALRLCQLLAAGSVATALLWPSVADVAARPSNAERVPSGVRVLDIRLASRHSPIVVTNVRKVRQFARVVDRLPVDTAKACSEGVQPATMWFTFRRSVHGPMLAKASTYDGYRDIDYAECLPTWLSARGHKLMVLYGSGYMIKQAEKILGRKLN